MIYLLWLLSLPLPTLLADSRPSASSSPSLHTMTGALLFKFCLLHGRITQPLPPKHSHHRYRYLIALVLHSRANFFRANSLSSWLGPSRARRISSVNCLRRWYRANGRNRVRKSEKQKHESQTTLKRYKTPHNLANSTLHTFSIHFLSSALSWLGNSPAFGGKIVVLLPARRLGDLVARCWLI